MELIVETVQDVERHLSTLRSAADRTQAWIAAHSGNSMDLLRSLKFDAVGFHPISDRGLNVIEQINQTFTYAVALAATRVLLDLHPDAAGFVLAPGAHMSRPLDVMSMEEGLVGAETFAAVHPRNNRKLATDLAKLVTRAERHRYVFFASPAYPGTARRPELDQDGVQVWSIEA